MAFVCASLFTSNRAVVSYFWKYQFYPLIAEKYYVVIQYQSYFINKIQGASWQVSVLLNISLCAQRNL